MTTEEACAYFKKAMRRERDECREDFITIVGETMGPGRYDTDELVRRYKLREERLLANEKLLMESLQATHPDAQLDISR